MFVSGLPVLGRRVKPFRRLADRPPDMKPCRWHRYVCVCVWGGSLMSKAVLEPLVPVHQGPQTHTPPGPPLAELFLQGELGLDLFDGVLGQLVRSRSLVSHRAGHESLHHLWGGEATAVNSRVPTVNVWLHYAYKVRNLGLFVRDCVFA